MRGREGERARQGFLESVRQGKGRREGGGGREEGKESGKDGQMSDCFAKAQEVLYY